MSTRGTERDPMTHPDRTVQVGGAWLALASVLMILTLGLHGPIAPHLHDQMTRIADSPVRWSVAHWIAAAGLSLYAVSGLIVLTSRSRLTDGWWTLTAWAVIPVGCLWTLTTAVAETTVVTRAAVTGSEETFAAWWAFAEGKANGFAFVALAVAVIAANEARHSARVTPSWAAWIAVVAGIGSFVGWALGMWVGFGPGSLLWVAATIVMSGWTLWFGAALAQARLSSSTDRTGPVPSGYRAAPSAPAPGATAHSGRG